MTNVLLTIGGITNKAIALFVNSNAFIMNVNRQYDASYAVVGGKIGSQLRVRLPNDYTVQTGPAITAQATNEVSTTITVATQKVVPMSFPSADMALSMDDFAYRVLKPAVNDLAGNVAADVMSLAEGVPNYVSKTVSSAVVSPTINEWLLAGALLDQMSAPRTERKVIFSPQTQARTVATFAGFFNPSGKVSKQYDTGEVTNALGYDWMMDQTTLVHQCGTFTAGTVNGASQTGTTLVTNAITGTLAKGDIFTINGVFAVNRVTKATTGTLQQFVVVTAAASGATSLTIYPAIVPIASGQYATTTVSPANSAALTLVNVASEQYRKNFIFRPEAFALVTADLPLPPKGTVQAARAEYDGLSLRMIQSYDWINDLFITRLDILYGYQLIRPEWACIVADIL